MMVQASTLGPQRRTSVDAGAIKGTWIVFSVKTFRISTALLDFYLVETDFMSVLIYIIRLSDRHKACPYESPNDHIGTRGSHKT